MVQETMKYEIWSEGYVCTGERSGAIFHTIVEAHSFKEACDKYFQDDLSYNPKRLTFWGCKLFDNETDARKRFG